jgi:hypothetical protein
METTLDNTTKVNVKGTDYTVIFNQVGDDRFEITVPEFGLFDKAKIVAEDGMWLAVAEDVAKKMISDWLGFARRLGSMSL